MKKLNIEELKGNRKDSQEPNVTNPESERLSTAGARRRKRNKVKNDH